ncbi:MAG: PH domain-containing protein [Candidatus Nanoarchaeia archaeon]
MGEDKKLREDGIVSRNNSRKIYLPLYVMAIILICLIIYIQVNNLELNNTVFIAAILFIVCVLFFTEIHRAVTRYEIRTESLVHIHGIFSRRKRYVAFHSISDIKFKQNFWQRLLRYGSIYVYQFSEDSATQVRNINKPEEFLNILEERINKHMQKRMIQSKT